MRLALVQLAPIELFVKTVQLLEILDDRLPHFNPPPLAQVHHILRPPLAPFPEPVVFLRVHRWFIKYRSQTVVKRIYVFN